MNNQLSTLREGTFLQEVQIFCKGPAFVLGRHHHKSPLDHGPGGVLSLRKPSLFLLIRQRILEPNQKFQSKCNEATRREYKLPCAPDLQKDL